MVRIRVMVRLKAGGQHRALIQIKHFGGRSGIMRERPGLRRSPVFRSVTESRRLPRKRRLLYQAEGLIVGALVCLLLLLGFAWLMAPPGS